MVFQQIYRFMFTSLEMARLGKHVPMYFHYACMFVMFKLILFLQLFFPLACCYVQQNNIDIVVNNLMLSIMYYYYK